MEPLTAEEELALFVCQDNVRFNMLESILSIPLGQRIFYSPFKRLLQEGEVVENIIDRSFWGIRNDRLPPSRCDELSHLLSRMNSRYLNRQAVRKLRLSWHRVEEIGKELFSGIEKCRKLLNRRKDVINLLGEDATNATMNALRFDSPDTLCGRDEYKAWFIFPKLSALRNELDFIEVETGADIHNYSLAAGRFNRASIKHNEIVERFVEANLRLVVSKVRKYYPCNVMEEMDLVQEGCGGLLKAVRRFDHHRGCKFSTFAVWWIRQSILKAILHQSRLVRLPASVLSTDSQLRRSFDDFTTENGYPPSLDELAAFTGIDRNEIEQVHLDTARSLSLDRASGEDDAPIAWFLESCLMTPDQEVFQEELRIRIGRALDSLSDREKTIISLRFGLFDGESCTLQDIGRVFSISRERVRQLETGALSKLRIHGLLSFNGFGE